MKLFRVTLPRISSYQELEELIKNSASNAVGNSPVRGGNAEMETHGKSSVPHKTK